MMEKLNGMVHRVREEQLDNTRYWYDDDTGNFLGQGQTSDEVIDHVEIVFPRIYSFCRNTKKFMHPLGKSSLIKLTVLPAYLTLI